MKLTEGGRLHRPNICWICRRTPPVGTPVIDTERYFDGYPFELNGRLYVCENCATQIAGFFDLVDKNTITTAQVAQAKAEAVVRGIKYRLDALVLDLKDIAADPGRLMMEVEDGSTRTEGSSGEYSLEGSPSEKDTEVDNLKGDQSDVSSEDRVAGSENSGSKRGSTKGSRAQSRPRKSANTAA